MTLSSTQRALIAVGLMVCAGALALGLYLYHARQPLPKVTKPGPAPDILSELSSDATAIAYLDVATLRKLQNSPLPALLGLAGTESGPLAEPHTNAPSNTRKAPAKGTQADREYSQFVADTGFDYSRDLDRAAIAFWPTELSPAANAKGQNPALAVAEGRFDQRKIIAYAMRVGGRTVITGSHTRYIVPGYPDVAFEFLSSTRIAIASGKNAANLLDLPAPGHNEAAIRARVNRVAGAPIFAVARTDRLPNSFYAEFSESPQLDHLVRSIQELALAGQPQDDAIRLILDGQCDSMTNAIKISTILDGFRLIGSMALADPKTRAQLQLSPEQFAFVQAFIKQAQVTHQDRWVRIALDATPAMLGQPSSKAQPAPQAQ